MKYAVNLGDIQGNDLPAGEYDAVIDQVQLRESKDKKSVYLNWQFSILTEGFANRKAWMMTSLSENALWKLKEVLVMLGFPKDAQVDFDIDEETGLMVNPDFVGRPVAILVKTRTYEGKEQSSVDSITADYYMGEEMGFTGFNDADEDETADDADTEPEYEDEDETEEGEETASPDEEDTAVEDVQGLAVEMAEPMPKRKRKIQ